MLQQLIAEIAAEKLPPLPIRAFPMSHVFAGPCVTCSTACRSARSFSRHRAAATSRLTMQVEMECRQLPGYRRPRRPRLAVAQWLVDHGVRDLILIGRRAPNEAAAKAIETWRDQGIRVLAATCDVAQESELAAVLERGKQELLPLTRRVSPGWRAR